MFAPDVEARFRKIEDHLTVAAEILHRFEMRTEDEIDHLKAVQNAMARWQDQMADRQARTEEEMSELRAALLELSRTVDRFLRARTDGGVN